MSKTVVIPIESDGELGRVIGREGRNIQLIERLAKELDVEVRLPTKKHSHCLILTGRNKHLVGCCLKGLLLDGRIFPNTIQDVFIEARREIEREDIDFDAVRPSVPRG